MRETTPGLVQHGGRVGMPQTPCLFAPADDRNTLATPTAGGAIQSQPTRCRRARCQPATVQRCTALGNKIEGRFGLAL